MNAEVESDYFDQVAPPPGIARLEFLIEAGRLAGEALQSIPSKNEGGP